MYNILKQSGALLLVYKGKIFLFFALCLVFFIFMFPWSQWAEKKIKMIQENTAFPFQFLNLKLRWLPPQIELQNLSLKQNKASKPFEVDSVRLSIVLKKWLAFQPTWKVQIKKDSSVVVVTISKKSITQEDNRFNSWDVHSYSSFLSLVFLKSFFSNLDLQGHISYKMNFKGSMEDLQNSQGFLDLKSSNIQLLGTQLKTNLGGLNLPSMKWSYLKASVILEESSLTIKSLTLGSKLDHLYIRLRGNLSLKTAYEGFPKMETYDLQSQIEVSQKQAIPLLDLFLSKTKKIEGDRIIYKARIKGSSYGVPTVEPLIEDF